MVSRSSLLTICTLLFALFASGMGLDAYALDAANVLPAGIHSPAIRVGVISGLSQRYTQSGSLMSLGDLDSIEFDTKAIVKVEPRVQQLVSVLDQFGRQNLGSALSLGVLKVNTAPEVRYLAPLHAYGVTKHWTLAMGVPIVTYKNRLSLSQTGSNIEAIHAQVKGLSKDLESAFQQLNVGLVTAAKKELQTKGYRALEDRDETFVGDMQLASLYQFYQEGRVAAVTKTFLTLPTGPTDDPDDLADLGVFGQTAVEQQVLVSWLALPRLNLAAKASYLYNLPERVIRRVPTSEDDTLPGPETKQTVHHRVGDTITAGVSGSYRVWGDLSLGAGFDYLIRASDTYSGDRASHYDWLARDTEANSGRTRLGIIYDTTAAYFQGRAMLPMLASYEFSDTVRGSNIERRTIHELWLTLFF